MKLNAKQLRQLKENIKLKKRNSFPIYFILENIYDTYNIGGLFRLADALAVEKIFLCGECEIPPNPKIKKASVGTYKIVPWEYFSSTTEVIEKLKKYQPSIKIIAVEQNPKSKLYHQVNYSFPLALIFGNETFGVLKKTLALSDLIVEIPMFGVNRSLNVIVAAAIVGYHIVVNYFKNHSPF